MKYKCGARVDREIERAYENQEGLEDVEQLARASLVAGLHRLANDVNHGGQEILE